MIPDQAPSADPYADVGKLLLDVDQFAETFFRVKLWDKPREMLESVDNNQRTIVPACHASSKTHTASIAALRWPIMRLNKTSRVEVVTTGPTWTQVEALLWGEIHERLENSKIRLPRASTIRKKRTAANGSARVWSLTNRAAGGRGSFRAKGLVSYPHWSSPTASWSCPRA